MKKLFVYLIILTSSLFLTDIVFAQDENYSRDKDKTNPAPKTINTKKTNSIADRIVYGGGLGLQLGNPTYIELSPKLGYRITEQFIAGGGISYMYYAADLPSVGKYKTSIYGGSLFTNYELIENLFVHFEFEFLNFEYYNNNSLSYMRKWVNSPFIGVGYRQPIGEKGFIQLLLLYNLNYTSDSPYESPFIPRISIFL